MLLWAEQEEAAVVSRAAEALADQEDSVRIREVHVLRGAAALIHLGAVHITDTITQVRDFFISAAHAIRAAVRITVHHLPQAAEIW